MRVILASKSPRRKELLSRIISSFDVVPANIDEDNYPLDIISVLKAKKIGRLYPNDLIISADTIVILNHQILGKPLDEDDARRMLKMLSSNVHEVSTFYTIYCEQKNILITKQVTTRVYFNELSNDLIEEYVATKSPLDKAGAYGIQDKKFPLISKIEGDEDNVIGLPLYELKNDLLSLKIDINELASCL